MENYAQVEVVVRAPSDCGGGVLAELKLAAEPQVAFEVYRAAFERLTSPRPVVEGNVCGLPTPPAAPPKYRGTCRLSPGHREWHCLDPEIGPESYVWKNGMQGIPY